jgi:ABC-type lipoprotein release transport system permease subunit
VSGVALWRVLLSMAVRDLGVHKVKSLVVGMLMVFGTFLVVVSTSMLDSIQGSMEKSITSSLAGQAQIYAADAKDPLEIFGGMSMGSADYGEIPDFKAVREAVAPVEGVRAVVPMGITSATVFGGTELDRVLEGMRAAVAAGDMGGLDTYESHVRQIAATLQTQQANQALATNDAEKAARSLAVLERVQADPFWEELRADPAAGLELLDQELAPIAQDGRMFYLRSIGTDLDQFAASFDRFRIVDGQAVPSGQRGILLSKRFYEQWVKNRVARALDELKEEVDEGKRFADDATLRNRADAAARQYQRVVFQIAPTDAPALQADLRRVLGRPADDRSSLDELVIALLTVDDDNFAARYDAFYEVVAPRIRLYEIPVGEVVVLRGFTKSGYMRALNVMVYGTFEFDGLEKSDLAGSTHLVDLVTFRDLYGKMTAAQSAELDAIRAQVGVQEVSRDSIEDDLFGGGSGELEATAREDGGALDTRTYSAAEMTDGLALNAAIILDDPRELAAVLPRVQAALDAAGLPLQVVDWQAAAGIVGQVILVLKGVLYVAILVVFLVTVIIINNTMVMATMDRTVEIGTMRAIGAQRGFVVALFVTETIILGMVAGGIGAALGAGFIGWLGSVGIPAVADILVLLFAGPRLYPSFTATNLAVGVGAVTLISLLSTLYPSVLAARVPPVVAMQGKE